MCLDPWMSASSLPFSFRRFLLNCLRRVAVVGLVGACVAAATLEARPPDQAAGRDLAAADDARVAAMVAGDPLAVAPRLSEELRYGHSNGLVDTKQSFLDLIGTGRTRYRSYRSLDREFRLAADGMALATGRAAVTIENAAGRSDVILAYLAVWRQEQGSWRLLAWQSTRLPAEPAKESVPPAGLSAPPGKPQ